MQLQNKMATVMSIKVLFINPFLKEETVLFFKQTIQAKKHPEGSGGKKAEGQVADHFYLICRQVLVCPGSQAVRSSF